MVSNHIKDGYEAAKHNLVGYKIVMGVDDWRIEKLEPISTDQYKKLPFQSSFFMYWLVKRLGYQPSVWAVMYAGIADYFGYIASEEEWAWLHGSSCSRNSAQGWLSNIIKESLE